MPVLEQRITVIVRSVRAFLNLQAGVTRGGTVPWPALADQDRQLEEPPRELAELQSQPTGNGAEDPRQRQAGPPELADFGVTEDSNQRQARPPELAGYEANGVVAQKSVRAEQLIWMFGHSRTGSSWLSWMMAELENQERWHEPYVGMLFGFFMYQRLKNNKKLLNTPTFIMGEPYREAWLRSIKNFVLEGATARYPDLREDQYLVVKEPNGSIGSPLLMEATPESRMIFLIRDPRDVVASRLEAFKTGGWTERNRDYSTANKLAKGTRRLAKDYVKIVSKVQEAYEAHQGKKTLVRYEDLRHDTVDTMRAMYDALEVEADEAQLKAAVEKHSWENIPEDQKGSDKFFRKAQPGSWKDDLSPKQAQLIESITEPILSKYY